MYRHQYELMHDIHIEVHVELMHAVHTEVHVVRSVNVIMIRY